jgi:acetyltransferase-like isoleucine patch superfamily enzyme
MKPFVKRLARFAAQLVMMPFILWHLLASAVIGRDRALEYHSQWVALLPGLSGQYLRRAFLQWSLDSCHPTALVCFGTIFARADSRLGENVYIGPYCSFGSVVIERDAIIATAVQIPSGARMHGIDDPTKPIREQPGVWECITVGAGSWIGSSAIVMANVGAGCVVAAGAVVTKAIPDMAIAGGVPAKVLKSRLVAVAGEPEDPGN